MAQPKLPSVTIVSIGDSYASGQGAPDQSGPSAVHPIWRGDNRDGSADKCYRSNNAATVIAASLIRQSFDVQFLHLACSGATIADVTKQLATAGVLSPGSIDALIVSFGGNDVDFAHVVAHCIVDPCEIDVESGFPQAINNLAPSLAAFTQAVGKMKVNNQPKVKHVFITEYPDPSTTPYLDPVWLSHPAGHSQHSPFWFRYLGLR